MFVLLHRSPEAVVLLNTMATVVALPGDTRVWLWLFRQSWLWSHKTIVLKSHNRIEGEVLTLYSTGLAGVWCPWAK